MFEYSEIKKSIKKAEQCHAQPASDDKPSSGNSGEKPRNEPSDSAALIQLQANSETTIQILQLQAAQIKDLQQAFQFLSTQVKALVDALAEDQDPDAPLTHYMSGKPI